MWFWSKEYCRPSVSTWAVQTVGFHAMNYVFFFFLSSMEAIFQTKTQQKEAIGCTLPPPRRPLWDETLEDRWMYKWMTVHILFVSVDNKLWINITVEDSFVVQTWTVLAIFGSCATVVNDGLSLLPHMLFMTERPNEIRSLSEVSASISASLSANQRHYQKKELYSFFLCVNPQQPGSIQPPSSFPASSAAFTEKVRETPSRLRLCVCVCVDITSRLFGCVCQSAMTELNTGIYPAITTVSGQALCRNWVCGIDRVCVRAEGWCTISVISEWVCACMLW